MLAHFAMTALSASIRPSCACVSSRPPAPPSSWRTSCRFRGGEASAGAAPSSGRIRASISSTSDGGEPAVDLLDDRLSESTSSTATCTSGEASTASALDDRATGKSDVLRECLRCSANALTPARSCS
eukprot:561816-Prymnesium_polylepis.2